MNDFITVFQNRQGMLAETIWEHLQISLISLIIAIVIAVPLGLTLTRYPRVAEPIIGLTAVLQTIPSLAVLAFLIPFFGIGTLPAVIALTAYGLLPILRNSYTGIKEVDQAYIEAATGMGMNSLKRLIKVELPIAMPVMMAGVRTSMVLIVGTTTLAALIGAGGLGEIILLGLDRGADVNLILLGAIPAALLAIVLDVILRGFERISKKAGVKSLLAMLLIAVLIVVTPFIIQSDKQEDIVIGGKLGSEPAILMNMYKQLIEAETDLNVQLKPNLGKTAFVFNALEQGNIDIYPEFSGTAIVTHLEENAISQKEREVYQQAKEGMKKQFDMAYLTPMDYNNTYTVATTKEMAERYNLKTVGDLNQVEEQLTAGFTLEFKDRYDGYVGMQDVYDLNISNVNTMDPGLRQKALASGEVDVIDAYATDSYMEELDLVALEDTKNLFPPYQGAPLLRNETLEAYPELEGILNQLGGKITDEQMRKMNYLVDYEDQSPEKVAREFLMEQGLLE
ncbi:ABC transporter permease [Virgibacillus pantothenticus]|uniref:Glycine/betaine ABC transporter permease n=1 Tax=Virgibacillus pantothenticus TaxID=1473 RepID=A0A0L0QP17_VIRPA|nr:MULTISPECIES: ABC transporter permease/substrate-binding protein [Virgibacillus]API94034.1 glycine/betaine ABC transporter permease [Virgibacillus sp. 6R]KNE20286.1 glycine/betaine ABC transporter permease [Virgibacillus pantothenticus]MBS7429404.1 ABC transporter permease/substrate-binding protein [Virgibacillus sp. 19R1-5]MBU8568079.1 ABC transporter permease/substrate-binding protein [Virgibacillus pantothenticus]MBU8602025.1 ABC transporter permease/substrate-binding protein [Virgibacil